MYTTSSSCSPYSFCSGSAVNENTVTDATII